jgi:hypothetical protein
MMPSLLFTPDGPTQFVLSCKPPRCGRTAASRRPRCGSTVPSGSSRDDPSSCRGVALVDPPIVPNNTRCAPAASSACSCPRVRGFGGRTLFG